MKKPTGLVNFNSVLTNPTFVVIWPNQYITYILEKVVKVNDTIIHAQHYLPNQSSCYCTAITPCTRCNLFDLIALLPNIHQQRHKFCTIKLPKAYCSIF